MIAEKVDMNGMSKCPKCGSVAKRRKVSLQARLLVGLAKLVVHVDPVLTPFANKQSGTMYRCPNCGHEWHQWND